jgi:hypothetical protein
MSDDQLRELEDHEAWEEGERREPVRAPRAVVSVAFSRADFETVSKAAAERKMKTSEFIRTAALDRAIDQPTHSVVLSVVGAVRQEHSLSQSRGARLTFQLTHDPKQNFLTGVS